MMSTEGHNMSCKYQLANLSYIIVNLFFHKITLHMWVRPRCHGALPVPVFSLDMSLWVKRCKKKKNCLQHQYCPPKNNTCQILVSFLVKSTTSFIFPVIESIKPFSLCEECVCESEHSLVSESQVHASES